MKSLLSSRKFWITVIGCAQSIAIAIVTHAPAQILIAVVAAQTIALVGAIAYEGPPDTPQPPATGAT